MFRRDIGGYFASRRCLPACRSWKASQPARVADPGTAARRGYRGRPSVKPVLQLKGVGKTYCRGDEQVHVLVDFDFTLDAGEFVVTGPSGAGKSTLLHIAGGLDAPDAGTVAVAGQDVWSMSTGARGVPAAQPRICVPVLQLGANADRSGERVVAAGSRQYACPISRRTR